MYGQMTAGSWIYIGSQGIVQGTYENSPRRPAALGGSLGGRAGSLTAGLGGMGGAQPLAVTMAEAWRCASRSTPCDKRGSRPATSTLDRVARRGPARAAAAATAKPLSIGLLGNAADVYPELVRRGAGPTWSPTRPRLTTP